MHAKITEKHDIVEGTLYMKLGLSEQIDFKAGQFFRLTLINPPYTDNRGNGRFLGFVNSPSQNTIIETVTRLGPSAFKRFLNEAPVDTEVDISAVGGEMLLPDSQTNLVIVTGGIGIVPYMSMFRLMREQSLNQKVTLIYSNTRTSWALFMDELENYSRKNPNFNFIPTMTQDDGWQGEKRRIGEELLREKIPAPQDNLYYISGTPRFVPSVVTMVKSLGVTPQNLKFEIFTGY